LIEKIGIKNKEKINSRLQAKQSAVLEENA